MHLKNKRNISILSTLIIFLTKISISSAFNSPTVMPQPIYGSPSKYIETVYSNYILAFIIGIIVAFQKKLTKKSKIISIICIILVATVCSLLYWFS